MKQDRLAPFMNREATKSGGVNARRTQELRGGAKVIECVRKLTKAEGDADFFTADTGRIRRERRIEIALVVFGAAFHRCF